MKKVNYLLVMLVLILTACTKPNESIINTENIVVKAATAELKPYISELNYSGSITAAKEANLGAIIPGKVETIFVKEGDIVEKGQLIAQLSDELFTQVSIELNAIRKDYNRIEQLYQKGSISEMEHDHLKAKLDATEEKYNMLQKNTQITAPFTGSVVEILVNEGENFFIMPALNPGYSHASGVVRLMDMSEVKVNISINEKDISKIKKGLITEVRCDAYPNEVFQGKVHLIHPILSNMSRAANVEIMIDNSSKKLMPGMFCKATIKLPEDRGIFIPRYAMLMQTGSSEAYTFVASDNIVEKRSIKVLKSIGDEILVSNISDGEQVITAGKTKLKSGDLISIDGGK
ncbi:MAG: efflux RND transporter periplasmic adaptor subunit [Candidatus Cloacimonadales bacterium]|jgi:membrane fusion protein (multidrug efflux system)|nr:efflux RND transporter periplasmic adaptor subunit [Candidatus Cloacimonadota bacterium]MDD2650610.1 efflux RND transporter periplasmic adaptor subunit [Candidatus Cloacimonadota bacterium]MDX9977739.1 efflux RND transporter periplasmic adaptor subunit [Candidatus Cloacimonadales bacterium]